VLRGGEKRSGDVKRSPRIARKRSQLKPRAVTVSATASGVQDMRQDEVSGIDNEWEAVVDRVAEWEGKRVNGVIIIIRRRRRRKRRQVYLSKNL